VINLGVVGYGYWGPNLVRNFYQADCFDIVAVSDTNEERLGVVSSLYPRVRTTTDYRKLVNNPSIDAIVIATPVSTHYEIALAALKAGKHVFVEKPLAETTRQAEELVEQAALQGLVLHVDHTFLYTGAVNKICELVSSGELGELYYYDSVRVNLGLFQPDVSVMWDLAVHDLAILLAIHPEKPVSVSATGMSHVEGKPANIAFITLFFESKMIAHIHVNWLAPVKVRRTLIGGSRKMVVYDDVEPSEKIKIYDKGITIGEGKEDLYKTLVGYRMGDMVAPQLSTTEALFDEVKHFARRIMYGEPSLSDGKNGLDIVRILEAATRSLNSNGLPVDISWPLESNK
jgi:predicted dehydrogenase